MLVILDFVLKIDDKDSSSASTRRSSQRRRSRRQVDKEYDMMNVKSYSNFNPSNVVEANHLFEKLRKFVMMEDETRDLNFLGSKIHEKTQFFLNEFDKTKLAEDDDQHQAKLKLDNLYSAACDALTTLNNLVIKAQTEAHYNVGYVLIAAIKIAIKLEGFLNPSSSIAHTTMGETTVVCNLEQKLKLKKMDTLASILCSCECQKCIDLLHLWRFGNSGLSQQSECFLPYNKGDACPSSEALLFSTSKGFMSVGKTSLLKSMKVARDLPLFSIFTHLISDDQVENVHSLPDAKFITEFVSEVYHHKNIPMNVRHQLAYSSHV